MTFFVYAFGDETQKEPKDVKMESSTEAGQVIDVGSLYAQFTELPDTRRAWGKPYKLAPMLILLRLAKLCGEDTPSAIAEWAKNRAELLCEMLGREEITPQTLLALMCSYWDIENGLHYRRDVSLH